MLLAKWCFQLDGFSYAPFESIANTPTKGDYMEHIIGYETEKRRIEEIADVLKNKEKYQEKGIYIPKGLLLSGPAGVGKTMFAKYLADLSGAKFYAFTPSDGENAQLENAAKLKMLFEEASKNTPSIIFVDELDSYLPDYYYKSDRSNDFLAALLKALDGEGYEGIMFVGACIDFDDIPDQVIRSGRIDESIILVYPDVETRHEIIDYYLSKVDISLEFDTKALAYKTTGFVGADIKNLVNMASRIAIRKGESHLSLDDFMECIYTIRHKDIKRDNSEDEKYQIAIHEIGHLVVGRIMLKKSFDVTIDSYDYIKGMVSSIDDDDSLKSEDKLFYLSQITTCLGGKASEEHFFNSTTSGCYSDINKSLRIIERMFRCGMFGYRYLDLAISNDRSEWSNLLRKKVERKTINILQKSYKIAKRIIKQSEPLIIELVKLLMDKTVMVAEETNSIFEKYGI